MDRMTDVWKLITLAVIAGSAGCAAGWFACGWAYSRRRMNEVYDRLYTAIVQMAERVQ